MLPPAGGLNYTLLAIIYLNKLNVLHWWLLLQLLSILQRLFHVVEYNNAERQQSAVRKDITSLNTVKPDSLNVRIVRIYYDMNLLKSLFIP